MDIWNLLSLLSKFALYIGVIFASGSVFYGLIFENDKSKSRFSAQKAIIIFAMIGLIFAFLSYGIRAANLAGEVSGMFDPEIIGILWQTPVGTVLVMRVIGLTLVLIGALVSRGQIITLLGSLIALASFAWIGHVSEAPSSFLKLVLFVHLLCIALWVGILFPLYRLSDDPSQLEITANIAHRFGQMAIVFVPILLAAGLWLGLVMVGSIKTLLTTGYGQILLIKIAMVAGLLGLAAANKMRFVPALRAGDTNALKHLHQTVRVEIVFVFLILFMTALLTSLVTLPEVHK